MSKMGRPKGVKNGQGQNGLSEEEIEEREAMESDRLVDITRRYLRLLLEEKVRWLAKVE